MPDITIPREVGDDSLASNAIVGDVVTPEVVAAHQGTLAAKLRAKQAQLRDRHKRFPIPPDDVWEGDLVLDAVPVDLSSREGMSNEQLIIEATRDIYMRNDEGEFERIEDGWVGIAKLMGIYRDDLSLGEVVRTVLSSKEVVGGFADRLAAFTLGRRSKIEQALGE